MLRPALALPFVLAIAIPEAIAQPSVEVNRCATAETDIAFAGNDFVNFTGDTGWFPGSSPAQLRLTARVAGTTNVASGYTATGCWGDSMQTKLAPRAGTGHLEVAYGAELALYGRIHVSVLGQNFDWEGRIDIPYIPDDLLIGGIAAFNPRLATTTAATVTDSTQPVNVISTNQLAQVISLGGISGGVYVSVKGSMVSSFRAAKTSILTTGVDDAMDLVTMARPETGFASTLKVPVTVNGIVRYAPKLTFAAGFNLKILGIQVVNWELASVGMTLPALERTVKLAGDPALLELPELEGLGDGARMDFSSAETQILRIRNTGTAALELAPANVPSGVSVAPVMIAAGAEGDLTVTAARGSVTAGATLTLATNDPDRPSLAIELAESGGTDAGDEGTLDEDEPGQSGGCSTSGGQGAGLMLFALGLVVLRRRSRR